MSDYEVYTFLLCLIVFVLLTVLFTALMIRIVTLTVKLIRTGAEDERIRIEYEKAQQKGTGGCIGKCISAVFTLLLCLFCALSVYVNIAANNHSGIISDKIPSISVVQSGSMSYKHEKNTYLKKNGLDDQLQTFDLIITHALPDEFALELYDIVVYEVDGTLIIHRIVGIEEPNDKHPDQRHFLLQGDALENQDRFPVYYSQMRAIYRGERIPFVGSFVSFLQSPAGYLCILLVLLTLIVVPLAEKKIAKEEKKRLTAEPLGKTVWKDTAERSRLLAERKNMPPGNAIKTADGYHCAGYYNPQEFPYDPPAQEKQGGKKRL